MSHLPPRPEFDYHSRPDSKYHGRPLPPPDHMYPPRERDSYRGSPPRPRYPPRTDSYMASTDSYVSRPPYPPSYDRHEDDRYRRREWERRERDYAPPPLRGETRDWRGRDRDRDRDHRWDDERSRGHDRERRDRSPRERLPTWARPREDDRRPTRDRALPPSPERTWVSRASKSPPRRIVGDQPSGSNEKSTSRPRSPYGSPRRRPQSPAARYTSPPLSPALYRHSRRVETSGNSRLGNHSISASPRRPRSWSRPPASRQGRYHPEDRDHDRGSWRRSRRSHSRSWSRSPSPSRRSRSRSPRRRIGSRGRGRSRTPSDRRRERSMSTDSEPGVAHSREQTPRKESRFSRRLSPQFRDGEHRIPGKAGSVSPPNPKPVDTISIKPTLNEHKVGLMGAGSSKDVRMSSPHAVGTSAATISMAAQQASKVRESSSPATVATLQVRRNDWDHIKTPTTPMSPQVDSPFTPLPPKPEWTSRASTSTPPTSAEPPPAPDDTPLPDLPEIPQWKRTWAVPLLVSRELAQVIARKERATAEYHEIAREARRARHEYDMACIDLRAAENKRKVAGDQLELARSGLLGIEYRPGPSNP